MKTDVFIEWKSPQPVSPSPEAIAAAGGYPLVAQVLMRRGFSRPEDMHAFLDPQTYTPAPAEDLPDLETACQRLESAIQKRQPICVWGDFDVDGQTSTTILVSCLRDLGAIVSHHIPVREKESHGIQLEMLKSVIARGAQLILTCDTGIAAHEPIAYAQEAGIDVLVTDHHSLPAKLPPARALVNPQRLPAGHPLCHLPGAGVAYKLAEALYRRAGRPELAKKHLDLAALGIVADVATQSGDTRYLLQKGLPALQTTSRLGLQTLFQMAELNPRHLTEEHIGFVIGPRLNALGRLSDANPIVEFLTTHDKIRARITAQQLEGLNAERKLLTDQIFQAALGQIERQPELLEEAALVLWQAHWHPGVIGIVASRLVEQFNRPVILFATPKAQPARGSARSIAGINITAAIAAQADILLGFGGHPMAAGCALLPENLPAFRRRLSSAVRQQMPAGGLPKTLEIDALLPWQGVTLDLTEQIEHLAPFGAGNPPLTLVSRNLHIISHKTIGRNSDHRLLEIADAQNHTRKVVWWNSANQPLPAQPFDLAYTARQSNFQGNPEVQIVWLDAHPAQTGIRLPARPAGPQIIDLRDHPQPDKKLAGLLSKQQLMVWAEGALGEEGHGLSRSMLTSTRNLAIWTIPPGASAVQYTLKRTQPSCVYLFAVPPQPINARTLLERLSGLLKFAISHRQGQFTLADLAGACAQTEAAVQAGLNWLAARGYFSFQQQDDWLWRAQPGDRQPAPNLKALAAKLQRQLDESAAYREYYTRAQAKHLLK